jgi:HEAT repeat protein
MMADNGTVFPAFLELLIHEKWSVRLGAMVSFEHLAEMSMELSSRIIASLWDRFPDLDDQIRGDVLYLMGESRNPEATPILKSVLDGDYSSELKEAAQEAMESLSQLS